MSYFLDALVLLLLAFELLACCDQSAHVFKELAFSWNSSIPLMSDSEAYHFEGTGIHWSMTEVASVAPFCLDSGLVRGFPGKVTYATFFENRIILGWVKMAWLLV